MEHFSGCGIHERMCVAFKEEFAWAIIDVQPGIISNKLFFKTVVSLKNKAVLNSK